ncbi:DUF732 domain-containing protein [Nocardia vulneris]|nr:DUF732 domain-containing protein [Nocardia vulneris]
MKTAIAIVAIAVGMAGAVAGCGSDEPSASTTSTPVVVPNSEEGPGTRDKKFLDALTPYWRASGDTTKLVQAASIACNQMASGQKLEALAQLSGGTIIDGSVQGDPVKIAQAGDFLYASAVGFCPGQLTGLAAPTTAPAPTARGRCQPAPDGVVSTINGAFKNSAYRLADVSAIQVGELLWVGGNIMNGATKVSSADVWISKGPVTYAISGDARRQTTLPDGRDVLNVSAGDDDGIAVQGCVTGR